MVGNAVTHASVVAIDRHHAETQHWHNKRQIGGRQSEEQSLAINDSRLHHGLLQPLVVVGNARLFAALYVSTLLVLVKGKLQISSGKGQITN